MCTVSYLPKGKNSFILTSNRDEKSSRSKALFPSHAESMGERIVFPKDPDAGGSWIAAASSGKVVCLLNGAFLPFTPKAFYQKSRGLVLLDVLKYETMLDFSADYDLSEVAPFTIVAYFQNGLQELRWDGEKKFLKSIRPDQPHLWSSVTLYSEAVMEQRNNWFRQWLNIYPDPSLPEVRSFHHTGGNGDMENDFKMNRSGQLYTVSVTSIVKQEDRLQMIYEDIVQDQRYQYEVLMFSAAKTNSKIPI